MNRSLEDRIYTVATTRDEALEFADPIKFELATAMRLGTPAICLACQLSKLIPDTCIVGEDILGEVSRRSKISMFNAPIKSICPQFISNVKTRVFNSHSI